MAASRVLVGITARSLADLAVDVTLPQFRALVVLASRGPQRPADISAELAVAPSTGTRMCERLIRKGLARRTRSASDRREVRIRLTPAGRDLVEQALRRRHDELSAIVAATAEQWSPAVVAALEAFAASAGELPEQEWWLGWEQADRGALAE
jgi:DNA-binding MarR family transcriptional regulator